MPSPVSATAIATPPGRGLRRKRDLPAQRRVPERVGDHIVEHLGQPVGVGPDIGRVARFDGEPDTGRTRARLERGRRLAQRIVSAKPGRAHRQLARVGEGEGVERLDQPGQPLGLDACRADALGCGRERAALDQLERAQHGRHRRAEVVRHVGGHLLPQDRRLGEAGAHRVERQRQRAHLVTARHVDRLP